MQKSLIFVLFTGLLVFGCLGGSPDGSSSYVSNTTSTVSNSSAPPIVASSGRELFDLVSVQPELNTLVFQYTGEEIIERDSFEVHVTQNGERIGARVTTPAVNVIEPYDSVVVTLDHPIEPRQLLSVRVLTGKMILFGRDYAEPFAVPSQKTYSVAVALVDSIDEPFERNMTRDWVAQTVLNGNMSINEWFLRATDRHVYLTGPLIAQSLEMPFEIEAVVLRAEESIGMSNLTLDSDRNGEMDALVIFVPEGTLTRRVESDLIVRHDVEIGGSRLRTLIISELSINRTTVANVTKALFTSLDLRAYGTPPEARAGMTQTPPLNRNACQWLGAYDALSDEGNLSRPQNVTVARNFSSNNNYKTTILHWQPSLPLLSAYTRMKLGFSDVVTLGSPDANGYGIILYTQENTSNTSILKLPIDDDSYYLFEYRNEPELKGYGLDGLVVYRITDRNPTTIGSMCADSERDNRVFILAPGESTSRRNYVPRTAPRPFGRNTGIYEFSLENDVDVVLDRERNDSIRLTFLDNSE